MRASPKGRRSTAVEEVVLAEIDRLRTGGITPDELKKVHAQLRARFVYDGDSVTDIAHQIGYFETIASWSAYHSLRNRLDAVTIEQVQAAAVKYLTPSNRTIGWFEPCRLKPGAESKRRPRQRRHHPRQVEPHHSGGEHRWSACGPARLPIRPIATAPRRCARACSIAAP